MKKEEFEKECSFDLLCISEMQKKFAYVAILYYSKIHLNYASHLISIDKTIEEDNGQNLSTDDIKLIQVLKEAKLLFKKILSDQIDLFEQNPEDWIEANKDHDDNKNLSLNDLRFIFSNSGNDLRLLEEELSGYEKEIALILHPKDKKQKEI